MSQFPAIERPSGHPLVTLDLTDDSIAVLRLNDDERRNALRIELVLDLEEAVREGLSRGATAFILTAAPPIFCSGGDLDDLLSPRASLEDITRGSDALAAIPVPTIAVVEGPVIGAGINLALACDVILCTPEAIFDPRILDLGIHPGGGQLRDLTLRVGRQGAVALSLLGDRLTGTEAAEFGLAWRCVPSEEISDLAMTFARRVASRPAEAIVRAKKTIDETSTIDRASARAIELVNQKWSLEQPWIEERVTTLRARLAHRSKD